MDNELFRKKSLDKMKSPDNIDDFIRVSNPGVWLLIVSVILLLLKWVWIVAMFLELLISAKILFLNHLIHAKVEDIAVILVLI